MRDIKKVVLASAYVSEVVTPTPRCSGDNDKIVVKRSSRRSVQRLVAADRCYSAADGRFYTVFSVRKDFRRCRAATETMYCSLFSRDLRSLYQIVSITFLIIKYSALLVERYIVKDTPRNCISSFVLCNGMKLVTDMYFAFIILTDLYTT